MLGIYCRISRVKEEGKDRSIDDQKLLGIEKSKMLGLGFELFIDEGLTAATDEIENRPEYMRMLEWISTKKLTAIFAFDQSRLEREPLVRHALIKDLIENDVKLYTHVDGFIDLNDPQVELFGSLVSVFNKYQVTMTKIKVKSVLGRRASMGKAHGIVPYGYTRNSEGFLIVDDEESQVIKEIYELSLNGKGTNSIAEHLNKKGVPTRYNKIAKGTLSVKNKYTQKVRVINKSEIGWSGNTIRNIISNPIYYGKRCYGRDRNNNKIYYSVPEIFDEFYWKKVNENFKNNSNTRGKKNTYEYLLKGLIRCKVCGKNMYGRTRASKKDHYYMCSSKRNKELNCGNRSINIDGLDGFIWQILFGKENFINRLESEMQNSGQEKIEVLSKLNVDRKNIECLKKENQELILLRTKNIISDEELIASKQKITSEIKKVEARILSLETKEYELIQGQAQVKIIRDKFVDYTQIVDASKKAKVINEIIKNIEINFNLKGQYYEILIDYKLGLPPEEWRSANAKATLFLRNIYDKDGKCDGVLFVPARLIDNPTDMKNLNRFKGCTGLLRDW